MTGKRIISALAAWLVSTPAVFGEAPAPPGWAEILPIFEERCINCHSRHGAARGLRLDSYEATVAGGDNGPVVVPGSPSTSELVRRLRGESTPRMPFLSNPLPQDEIDLIVRWIDAGLPGAGLLD